MQNANVSKFWMQSQGVHGLPQLSQSMPGSQFNNLPCVYMISATGKIKKWSYSHKESIDVVADLYIFKKYLTITQTSFLLAVILHCIRAGGGGVPPSMAEEARSFCFLLLNRKTLTWPVICSHTLWFLRGCEEDMGETGKSLKKEVRI